jgi:hypothetical protein
MLEIVFYIGKAAGINSKIPSDTNILGMALFKDKVTSKVWEASCLCIFRVFYLHYF